MLLSERIGPSIPTRKDAEKFSVSVSRYTTISPEVIASPRHMASPLPCAGPKDAMTSDSCNTTTSRSTATSQVPSVDVASMTTISSTSPESRKGATASRRGPIVVTTLRVGSTTLTVWPLSSRSSSWE